jgi:large subunit ribosomal protein L15
MQLHSLQKNTAHKKAKRVGRSGAHGKTSGRGHKGQKSRAGHKFRPMLRDVIKRLPKRRGYGTNRARTVNSGREKSAVVSLAVLETHFAEGDTVTPSVLLQKGLVRRWRGRVPTIKVLGTGDLSKKLIISNADMSLSAKEKIVKAGGTVLAV